MSSKKARKILFDKNMPQFARDILPLLVNITEFGKRKTAHIWVRGYCYTFAWDNTIGRREIRVDRYPYDPMELNTRYFNYTREECYVYFNPYPTENLNYCLEQYCFTSYYEAKIRRLRCFYCKHTFLRNFIAHDASKKHKLMYNQRKMELARWWNLNEDTVELILSFTY